MSHVPHIIGADPLCFPLDVFRVSVAAVIAKALHIPVETAFSGVDLGKKGVDFTVALPRFRLKNKPVELAERVLSTFSPDDYLERVTTDAPFVHFHVRTTTLTRLVLDRIHASSHAGGTHVAYGSNRDGVGKKVVLEFSSPNIAKPFHAGHLRSTIIGTFLANLFAANGWETIRMNYLGDWGKQYGLLAVGFERYGSEDALAQNAIMHLFNVYVQVNADARREKELGQPQVTQERARQVFHEMENGDEATLAVWQRFRDLSIAKYREVYARLNVKFDIYAGESLVQSEGMAAAMDILREKELLVTKTREESDPTKWKRNKRKAKEPAPGMMKADEHENIESDVHPDGDTAKDSLAPLALAVDLSKWKLEKPVVQKPDGTSIYIVRDIAGAYQRYAVHGFDKMIYVVGDQQDMHVAQLFKILELMGAPFASRLEHVNFGKVHGMSTRTGEVKFLDEILDMSKDAMLAQMAQNPEKMKQIEDPDETADQIGMTCAKIQDMQARRVHAYTFDPQRMTSFEGDTGAYLQYAHVRLCSVERKVASAVMLPDSSSSVDVSLLVEPKAREIVFLLAIYPDVVRNALKTYEPSTIVSFCFRLSHVISSAWESLIVMGQEPELAQARLLLYACARDVLGNAMRLLSLTPLTRM